MTKSLDCFIRSLCEESRTLLDVEVLVVVVSVVVAVVVVVL